MKEEAAAVLAAMGLTVSGAFRLLLTKVAHEKALPFAPLVPNSDTIEAMREARRGKPAAVRQRRGSARRSACGRLSGPADSNATTSGSPGVGTGHSLDAILVPVVEALANDRLLEPRHHDHALSGEWGDHRDCHVKPDLLLIYQESWYRHPAARASRIRRAFPAAAPYATAKGLLSRQDTSGLRLLVLTLV